MVNGEYKNIMKMKSIKVIGYGLWVIGMLLVSVPTMAQQDQWQSTSSLPTSGSSYTPQVTAVGASVPAQQSAVGAPYSPAEPPSGPRRIGTPSDGIGQSGESPLGDGLIPLSLLALAYAGVVYFRKRKQTLNG